MYVYKQTEKPGWWPSPKQPDSVYLTGSLWTVGYYTPSGVWEPESDHESAEKAAERVAYLNGNRAVNRALDEALNSGDGVYRP